MSFGERGGGLVLIWLVANEVGAEEVEGEGEPEDPFAICVEGALVLRPAMFVVLELHSDIEAPALRGSVLLQHRI